MEMVIYIYIYIYIKWKEWKKKGFKIIQWVGWRRKKTKKNVKRCLSKEAKSDLPFETWKCTDDENGKFHCNKRRHETQKWHLKLVKMDMVALHASGVFCFAAAYWHWCLPFNIQIFRAKQKKVCL